MRTNIFPYMNPELRRECVDRVKGLATTRIPKYEQPSDGHIDLCVYGIYQLIYEELTKEKDNED